MKPLETTPREVLLEAIKSEVESRVWLFALADRASTQEVADKLRELAEREALHRVQMERKFEASTGEKPPDIDPPTINLPDELIGLDMRRAMKLVLERERDAESNFRFLAERVPNTELGQLFMELAEIEWKHKTDIQSEYDKAVAEDPDSFLEDLG